MSSALDRQQSLEGMQLLADLQARGYAEFDHGIPDEEVELVIERYADFTLNYPDPEPATMDAMLPQKPTSQDLVNPKYSEEVEDEAGEKIKTGIFSPGTWMSKKLDELDRTADTQAGWHKYRTNIPQVGKPDGYTNRSFQERALKQARGLAVIPSEDPKEFYHFTPCHYATMARTHVELGWGSIPQEVGLLNGAFAGIHQKAAALMLRVCSIIEETHPEITRFITPESLLTSPIRLLFYHPTDNEQLGAGHYDKSGSTLQLAESHEGLRVGLGKDSPLKEIVRPPNQAVYFPGKQFAEAFPDTPFQPGWHDIVSIDRYNEGRTIPSKAIEVCARYALILFANPVDFVQPDKSETHKR